MGKGDFVGLERNTEAVKAKMRDLYANDPEYRAERKQKVREYEERQRRDNPEEFARKKRERSLKTSCRKYGITIEHYEKMHEAQSGLCAICKKPETRRHKGILCRLSIDYCHATGEVRELLCDACNTAIGRVNDDLDLLWACFAYLVKHKGN